MISLRYCWSGVGHYARQVARCKKFVVESREECVVALHFRNGPHEWGEVTLPRVRTLAGGRSIHEWSDEAGALPAELEFALRADAPGGESAWDNDGGANYHLGSADGPLLRIPLVLATCGLHQGIVSGVIYVRNLAYEKTVRVHHSTDEGASWRASPASFRPYLALGPRDLIPMPNRHGAEAWDFTLPEAGPQAQQLRLWLEAEMGGRVYRDDDDGAGYRLALRS